MLMPQKTPNDEYSEQMPSQETAALRGIVPIVSEKTGGDTSMLRFAMLTATYALS
ncbi:hypothetical protein ACFJIW_06045 [Tahibacter sp. UC22_41]|uniref:hypothetical protein n=1 Tax=Tahibacter sp. UC22_41 TaxID=3350178 RepID=UPI0036D9C0E1